MRIPVAPKRFHLQGDDVPSLSELLAPLTQAERDNLFSPEGVESAYQRLQRIEDEIARVKADYEAGKIRFKFDPNQIYSEKQAKLAHKYSIDYVGVALLLSEKYERNPIKYLNKQQARKKWFTDQYRTENELRDHVGAMLNTIALLKLELMDYQAKRPALQVAPTA